MAFANIEIGLIATQKFHFGVLLVENILFLPILFIFARANNPIQVILNLEMVLDFVDEVGRPLIFVPLQEILGDLSHTIAQQDVVPGGILLRKVFTRQVLI